jgi:hypothetical protein
MFDRQQPQKSVRTLMAAALLSVGGAALIFGMVYYTLQRHDRQHLSEIDMLRQEQAVAAAREFALLSGGLIVGDLFRIHEWLMNGGKHIGLVEADIIDVDHMVIASSRKERIGRSFSQTSLAESEFKEQEVVKRHRDQSGQEALTVLEPLVDQQRLVAWARFTFLVPTVEASVPSSAALTAEAARLTAPIAMALFAGIWLVLRLTAADIRKNFQRASGSAQAELPQKATVPLRKVG